MSRADVIRAMDEVLNARGMSWVDIAVPPQSPEPTPNAFCDWVYNYSTYNNIFHNARTEHTHLVQERLKQGKWDHRRIELFFLDKWAQTNYPGTNYSHWEKVYIDRDDDNSDVLLASRLIVGGEPLRGKPDGVFRYKSTGTILIVERKTTWVPCNKIPLSGWPNIQAQLWCYSWMDQWLDAEEVILLGDYWRSNGTDIGPWKMIQGKMRPEMVSPGLRSCKIWPTWRRSDQAHQAQCESWFRKYGGIIKNN